MLFSVIPLPIVWPVATNRWPIVYTYSCCPLYICVWFSLPKVKKMPIYLNSPTNSIHNTKKQINAPLFFSSGFRFCWTVCVISIDTPPFMSAKVGSMRHPALGVWGSHQMGLALQLLLVLWIVFQPAEQGLTGIISHTSVGQAHCQSHEGWEVVWVEL